MVKRRSPTTDKRLLLTRAGQRQVLAAVTIMPRLQWTRNLSAFTICGVVTAGSGHRPRCLHPPAIRHPHPRRCRIGRRARASVSMRASNSRRGSGYPAHSSRSDSNSPQSIASTADHPINLVIRIGHARPRRLSKPVMTGSAELLLQAVAIVLDWRVGTHRHVTPLPFGGRPQRLPGGWRVRVPSAAGHCVARLRGSGLERSFSP
jgi:hypothetical protein